MDGQEENTIASTNQGSQADAMLPQEKKVLVEWSASEYIAHHKSAGWYAGLGVAVAVFSTIVYLFTRDIVSSGVIVVVGVLFGVFASRPPEVRNYQITPDGLIISGKLYDFHMFKSFSIHDEGVVSSIFFMPVKRFLPGLNVYYPPEQEEEIVKALSDYLPNEETDPDMIDRFMRKVRF